MNPKCTNCGSDKIIEGLNIVDNAADYMKQNLSIETIKNPNAFLFKGSNKYELKAKVCGSCGKVEMTIDNPEELWNDHKRNKKT
ncbi:hypothetical protein [Aquimarina sp. MMG016]|uniref:hypothetical protein n=1 Tax=Aquimarina sp. MMG016 TaxID=2822690 RepID=UPI001B39DE1A|nr:hypothetical protein [Aquimarina sp. MMG016]MBQ4818747.1 hypothetical protein [Aquimarina sp. MMG016]